MNQIHTDLKNEVIVHCSATHPHQNITAKDVKRWHTDKSWRDIGYHWIIERDGTLVKGREGQGAHAKGHNNKVGVCLIGGVNIDNKAECNFTLKQWVTLDSLLKVLNPSKVSGHNQFSNKACPSFNAQYLLD